MTVYYKTRQVILQSATDILTKWRRSGVFIVNFEHILHLFLVFLFLTLNKKKNRFSKCIEGIADQTENIAEKLETQSPKTATSRTPSCYYV